MKEKFSIVDFIKKHPVVTIFIITCLAIPFFVRREYLLRVMIEMFFFGALGTAWNILGGFGRQTSWASAAFFAIGAYTGMLLNKNAGVSPWISIWIGMFFAIILAVIIGAPTLRLRGVFFSIATISCASILRQMILYFKDFTGGAQGLSLKIRTGSDFWMLGFQSERPYYYVAFAWMMVAVLVTVLIDRSKLGYYLKAIREDEDAAESLGIRAHRMKLIAFIISGMLLSATGTLYAFKIGYIDPVAVASHDMAIRIGVTAILGGMGTIWGPVMGAFICVPMLEVSNFYLGNFGGGGAGFALYGLAMVLVVLYRPNGVISIFQNIGKGRKSREESKGAGKVL